MDRRRRWRRLTREEGDSKAYGLVPVLHAQNARVLIRSYLVQPTPRESGMLRDIFSEQERERERVGVLKVGLLKPDLACQSQANLAVHHLPSRCVLASIDEAIRRNSGAQ